jgi:hypothetical protein
VTSEAALCLVVPREEFMALLGPLDLVSERGLHDKNRISD